MKVICDVCGKQVKNPTPNTKRHAGKCVTQYKKQYSHNYFRTHRPKFAAYHRKYRQQQGEQSNTRARRLIKEAVRSYGMADIQRCPANKLESLMHNRKYRPMGRR